jgi:hypothetical protein
VTVQRGDGLVELDRMRERPPLLEWGTRTTDLLATAEMLLALDLVITVDTMIAHLAGALAVPTWTLLHWQADWRWLSCGETSAWYQAMRLFRQRAPGCWETVIDTVAAELRALQANTNG